MMMMMMMMSCAAGLGMEFKQDLVERWKRSDE
jgi:phage regulator Rha-like protein